MRLPRDEFGQFLDSRGARLGRLHRGQHFAFQALVVFLERLDLVAERLQLLVVAHQVQAHPLVADLRLAVGEFTFEHAARGGRLLVFLGESV